MHLDIVHFFLRISVSSEAGSRQLLKQCLCLQIFVAMEKIITNVSGISHVKPSPKICITAKDSFSSRWSRRMATLAMSTASLQDSFQHSPSFFGRLLCGSETPTSGSFRFH